MISFFVALGVLIFGYLFYGKFIANTIFKLEPQRETPAVTMSDGVDYMMMPWWKVFLIQFLNIAGLGPIFGAVAGAMWGPVAFIWIALGSVFAGAVHDFFSGMLSVRHKGLSISEIVGIYLGKTAKIGMRFFTVLLMVIVGAVFIMGPAKILSGLMPDFGSMNLWIWIVFIYYILATILPVDKIIGRIYPIFGFALIFMAVGLFLALLFGDFTIPEISFENLHSSPSKFPIFPMLFITIACGAISGFHATQSPLMARCISNEKYGRPVFYGAMISEGVVALIWAAISMSFFGGVGELNGIMSEHGGNAAWVVNEVSNSLLGTFGGILALLGVVAAPITSGDTAFRSARLIVADFLNFNQASNKNRLIVSIPLFIVGFLLTQIDFAIVWRYFAWSNQTLATIVLWAITVFLVQSNRNYWVTLIPSVFMTSVITTYLLFAPEGFGLPYQLSVYGGILFAVFTIVLFMRWYRSRKVSTNCLETEKVYVTNK
ncbi:carbon starvation CstA family protein [Labilibaculum antarcticum]|uniref:Carbon starvation protein A n=1 Tax=Labilibaculum antarcticum TaxID=1717717 RepID=A0A1Y1CGU8_9BACT|nr:carbon starvation protein A [Labilibaculum antarcticum]BAX79313.1 carbon starvation protein A [Labilibaculum antarcticum]